MFTNKGRAYSKKVYEIPQGGRASRGKALVNFLELREGEKVVEMLPVREFSEGAFVMMATRMGKVKKTSLNAYANIRSSGIIAVLIGDDDDLVDVRITVGTFDVMLGTRNGMATRFREEMVRPMGRASGGVRGIKLREGDEVIGMAVLRRDSDETLITVCERGYGKRTALADYPIKNRGGFGVITIKASDRNGKVVGMRIVSDDDDLMIITDRGKLIRMPVHGIPTIGRNTQGVRLIRLDDEAGEKVVAVERLAEKADEGEEAARGVEVAAPVEAPTGELEFEAEEEGGDDEPEPEPEPENGNGEGEGDGEEEGGK
jgi:DNA gyrase subunit A